MFNEDMYRFLQEADSVFSDEDCTELDEEIAKRDLIADLEKIDPIHSEAAKLLNASFQDPISIPMIHEESTDKFYVEFSDISRFMTASNMTDVRQALNSLMEAYEIDFPSLGRHSLMVVLPCMESFMDMIDEATEIGYDKVKWSSSLLSSMVNCGIGCCTGVSKDEIFGEFTEQDFEDMMALTEDAAEKDSMSVFNLKVKKFFGTFLRDSKSKTDKIEEIDERIDVLKQSIKMMEKELEKVAKGDNTKATTYSLKQIIPFNSFARLVKKQDIYSTTISLVANATTLAIPVLAPVIIAGRIAARYLTYSKMLEQQIGNTKETIEYLEKMKADLKKK